MANAAPEQTAAPKLVQMELKRNYVPLTQPPRIVGYTRPERKAKDAAGRETIVQTEEFVEGEMMPPLHPGVGYANKVWAGTVIEVPEAEASKMRKAGIGEVFLA